MATFTFTRAKKKVPKERLAVSTVLLLEYLKMIILIVECKFTYIVDQLSVPIYFTYFNSENYADLDNFFNYFRIN